MKYPSRHNSKQSRIRTIAAFTVGLIVLGLLLPWLITSVSRIILAPFHTVHRWYHNSNAALPLLLKDRTALLEQIAALENELAIAGVTDLTTQRLFNENMWLRSLLGAETEERIAAAVIARPDQLPYDVLQIDRGSNQGIVEGAPVYIGLDVVIGIVVSTADNYSFVQLFSHPEFRATAFVSGANVIAPLEGFGGGVARVRVPQGIALKIGSVIHLPSINPGAFGKIAWIENDPSQPEQYGYIVLPESINGIQYIAVAPKANITTDVPILEERIRNIIATQFIVDTSALSVGSSTASTTPTSTAPAASVPAISTTPPAAISPVITPPATATTTL